MSLVNDSLKFTSSDKQICLFFFFLFFYFFFFGWKMWVAKTIRILCIESAKTVNEMTLNEFVKLTKLWTTGPRSAITTTALLAYCWQKFWFAIKRNIFCAKLTNINNLIYYCLVRVNLLYLQSTLVISTSLISNNRLSRGEKLTPA